MKYSGLSEEVTRRSKLESGSKKRKFGWLCVCHVSVEHCWGQDQGQGFRTQGELNYRNANFLVNIVVNRLSVLKYLACLLYSCK